MIRIIALAAALLMPGADGICAQQTVPVAARTGRDFTLEVEVRSYRELSLFLKQLGKECDSIRKKRFSRKVATIGARCKFSLDELQNRVEKILAKSAPGVAFDITRHPPGLLKVRRK